MEATTVTTIDSTMASLNDIQFPTIYICNINQVRLDWVQFLVSLVSIVLLVSSRLLQPLLQYLIYSGLHNNYFSSVPAIKDDL